MNSTQSRAEQMFTTDGFNVYEINGPGNGIFAETSLGHFGMADSTDLYSLACHEDTLYVITRKSNLYQVDLAHPFSCRLLANFDVPPAETPQMIAMVCDKNGLIYMQEYHFELIMDLMIGTYTGNSPAMLTPSGHSIYYPIQ